ncbi:MAG: GNAT family N-acetyltransferase [Actinomycetota bacterium]|nr:GNAT family N-acetyltransferase [Actinomycetota bacterium]
MNLGKPVSVVETERLLLRPFTPADFSALYAYQSRTDVTRYLLWDARTEDQIRQALDTKIRATAIASEGDFLALAAELKETGAVVGDFTLELFSAEHACGELGYIIHPDHHGRGYATEGGRAVLSIAFAELGLHRVIGRLEPRNAASARVLEKLGMRREAHFVENEYLKGEWQSEAVYAMLDREWREGTS